MHEHEYYHPRSNYAAPKPPHEEYLATQLKHFRATMRKLNDGASTFFTFTAKDRNEALELVNKWNNHISYKYYLCA
jgi:hypothetical protein